MGRHEETGHGKASEAAPVQAAAGGRGFHRRRGDSKPPAQSSYAWLVTFTDIMGLMLTFFVLMFSMVTPEQKNWADVKSALHSELNKFYGAVQNRGPQDSINIEKINFSQALNIRYLAALLETVKADSRFLSGVELIPQRGSLVISLPRDLLFEPGQATVREEGSRALYALGGALARIRNHIEIAGHADPRAIEGEGSGFVSNWDLSLARAASVAGILENVGYENDITIHGYGSGRYQDLQSITDEQQRQELARRVDIIVMDHDGAKNKVFFDIPAQ